MEAAALRVRLFSPLACCSLFDLSPHVVLPPTEVERGFFGLVYTSGRQMSFFFYVYGVLQIVSNVPAAASKKNNTFKLERKGNQIDISFVKACFKKTQMFCYTSSVLDV